MPPFSISAAFQSATENVFQRRDAKGFDGRGMRPMMVFRISSIASLLLLLLCCGLGIATQQ